MEGKSLWLSEIKFNLLVIKKLVTGQKKIYNVKYDTNSKKLV